MMPENLTPTQMYEAIKGMCLSPNTLAQIGMVSVSPLTPERFVRKCLMAIQRGGTPVMEATPGSVRNAMIDAAMAGIAPDGKSGLGFFITRYSGKDKCKVCNFQIGYKGLLMHVRKVKTLFVHPPGVVREGDLFEFELGTKPFVRHVPHVASLDRKDANFSQRLTSVYAIADEYREGTEHMRTYVEVMSRFDIDEVAAKIVDERYRGPWKVPDSRDWRGMARKTVLLQLMRYLPLPEETQQLAEADEMRERGMRTEHENAIMAIRAEILAVDKNSATHEILADAGLDGTVTERVKQIEQWDSLPALESLRDRLAEVGD